MTKTFKFDLGSTVEEKITGFTGIITGCCFYITGCNQYLVTAKAKENSEAVGLWYDEQRLRLCVNERIAIKSEGDPGPDRLPNVGKRGY